MSISSTALESSAIELDADVAVLGRPSGRDAADEHRRELRQPAQPCQRLLALPPQRDRVLVAAEQRVMVDERRLDLVVAGQRRAVGQQQLPQRLALGERPVRDAVLGDEPRRDVGDARAVLASRELSPMRPASDPCGCQGSSSLPFVRRAAGQRLFSRTGANRC